MVAVQDEFLGLWLRKWLRRGTFHGIRSSTNITSPAAGGARRAVITVGVADVSGGAIIEAVNAEEREVQGRFLELFSFPAVDCFMVPEFLVTVTHSCFCSFG